MLNHILGVLLMLLGFLNLSGAAGSQFFHERREAAKAEARAGPPPAAAPIEAFDRSRDIGPGAEATLIGQIAFHRLIEEPGDGTAWIIPMLPASAEDPDAPAGAFLIHETLPFAHDHLSRPGQTKGLVGVQATLTGELVDPRLHRPALIRIGAREMNPLVLRPHMGGREAALARDNGPLPTNLALSAGSLALMGYGFILYRRRNRTWP